MQRSEWCENEDGTDKSYATYQSQQSLTGFLPLARATYSTGTM